MTNSAFQSIKFKGMYLAKGRVPTWQSKDGCFYLHWYQILLLFLDWTFNRLMPFTIPTIWSWCQICNSKDPVKKARVCKWMCCWWIIYLIESKVFFKIKIHTFFCQNLQIKYSFCSTKFRSFKTYRILVVGLWAL